MLNLYSYFCKISIIFAITLDSNIYMEIKQSLLYKLVLHCNSLTCIMIFAMGSQFASKSVNKLKYFLLQFYQS